MCAPNNLIMSDAHEPTIEDINAELMRSKLEMEEKLRALEEKLQVTQECKVAEEEEARKVEEKWKPEEARLKAEAEQKAEEECKAKDEQQKAKAECKTWEASELRQSAERKRLDREFQEYKERVEAKERQKAEEQEKLKAGNGMMLATPKDVSALEDARRINPENARIWAEGFKPRARSSKAMATATTTAKPKTPVNLARQVREDERAKKTGHKGKNGDATVSSQGFGFCLDFLTHVSPGCYVRQLHKSEQLLHPWASGCVSGVQHKESALLVSGREAEAKERGGCFRGWRADAKEGKGRGVQAVGFQTDSCDLGDISVRGHAVR
jgi:hypothetical protein